MSLIIILLSILISVFIFLFFFNSRQLHAKALIKRIENYTCNITVKNKRNTGYLKYKFFLEERNLINILGIRIKTIEGLFVFRFFLSLSFLIFIIIIGFFSGNNFLLVAVLIAFLLFFVPSEIFKSKIRSISKNILREIPDVLDILSSLIKAGLNLDEAINYYSNNYKGEVSRLFKLVVVKIYEGQRKKDAYNCIAKLSFCNEFRTIIKIIIQADLIGNPINIVLKELSKAIRNNQRDQLKIRSERLENSLMLIIFVFMFIPMMVLFLLPIIPQLKMLF